MTIRTSIKRAWQTLVLSAAVTPAFAVPLPSGYVSCAMDNQACVVKAGTNPTAYYGTDGDFVSATKSANFTCNTASFNDQDPAQGKVKSCYLPVTDASGPGATGATEVSTLPASFTRCGGENNLCAVSGVEPWTGYYGASGHYVQIAGVGNFTCSLALFHVQDPANGATKSCYLPSSVPPTGPTGSNDLVPSIPAGYKPCATDGDICKVTGAWNGYYGAIDKFAPIEGSGEFKCLPGTFNIDDPLFGTKKTCYVNEDALTPPAPVKVTSVPLGFVACSIDGGVCNASGNWTVYYGANSSYWKIVGAGAFTCLPGDLGVDDPAFGTQKTCYVSQASRTVSSMPSTGYSKCGVDFDTCNANDAWTGYYGAQNIFVEIMGQGAFNCQPKTFNIDDPLFGTQKSCYLQNAQEPLAPNCEWQSKAGSQYNRYAANRDQCSCKCAANGAESRSCYFQGSAINDFVCKPGQYP